MSGEDAAAYLNTQYRSFDLHDETSPVGVVMRTTAHWGFFCDGFEGDAGCYMGFARCVTSASILNHRVMVTDKGQLYMGLARSTGIMFNATLVETKLGRCTYQFDGTSWGRYNRGCGGTAPNGEGMCQDRHSAWYNIDPHTGKECTDTSAVVLQDYCPHREKRGSEPRRSGDSPCFWKGPAFYTQNGFGASETHKMLSQRVRNQKDYWDQMTSWDEVVIDAELLLKELQSDPAQAIVAMVYEKNQDTQKNSESIRTAKRMAAQMQKEFDMDEPVPVVGVDTTIDAMAKEVDGPFFFGKAPTTVPTTTLPPDGPMCCWGGCSGTCQKGFCGASKTQCKSCGGEWCQFDPPVTVV
jgi:hypothetical protein